jgi:phenylalanyl-tRNA synthetase alpha chain
MDIKELVESLSDIETSCLKNLDQNKWKDIFQIQKDSNLPIDSVRRAIQWLNEKKFIEIKKDKKESVELTILGKNNLKNGLPERRLIQILQNNNGKISMSEIKNNNKLENSEINIAIGIARKNAWISIIKSESEPLFDLTGLEEELINGEYSVEKALNMVYESKEITCSEKKLLINRGLIEVILQNVIYSKLSQSGIKALCLLEKVKREFNIKGDVPKINFGKKQPYVQFLEQIRAKLVSLGFKEMYSPIITQEFYNFDVLFQSQNHPARSWSDTYQLKKPKFGSLPNSNIVSKIKAAHENGGNTGSTGWKYNWDENIAKKLMPASQGTAHSARQLVNGVTIPGKYFTIARCYRPDVIDASHLVEFNQMEGIIIDKNLNFINLLGIIKQFTIEIAQAKQVKFTTGYFPFTEPSCEVFVEHPSLGWVEVGGAGVFRPEITKSLGIEGRVLAWGLGIDRLAMCALEIKDIRDLFSSNLEWLRNSKQVVIE